MRPEANRRRLSRAGLDSRPARLDYGLTAKPREARVRTNAGDFSSLRFSTRGLAPEARLPALKALFETAVQLDVDTAPGHAVEMRMHRGPGLRRAQMLSALTARMARSRPKLADGEDTVCLMINTGGSLSVAQSRRAGEPRTGDGVLLVYREAAELAFRDATYLSIRVPFQAIAAQADVEAAAAACLPRENGALVLLKAYVAALPEDIADPWLGQLAARHVYDLMAAAIGARSDGDADRIRESVRAGRLAAIQGCLAQDATQSIEEVAGRLGLSPRYVQLLFQEAGTTFSRHALELRLEAARRMLAGGSYDRPSIAAIAYEAGFGDLSYFNRCFRRRYGMTPKEARHERPPALRRM